MNREDFLRLFDASADDSHEDAPVSTTGPGGPEDDDPIMASLEKCQPWVYDVSGDGTDYVSSGTRYGAGFAEVHLTFDEDGRGTVIARAVPVSEELEPSLRKLCRMWNRHFRLPGLCVRDGYLTFMSEHLDLVNGRFEAGQVVGMAINTVHAYTGAVLALKCGVEPWDLIEYDEWEGPGHDSDDDEGEDDDGEPIESSDVLDELLGRLSGQPSSPTPVGLPI